MEIDSGFLQGFSPHGRKKGEIFEMIIILAKPKVYHNPQGYIETLNMKKKRKKANPNIPANVSLENACDNGGLVLYQS